MPIGVLSARLGGDSKTASRAAGASAEESSARYLSSSYWISSNKFGSLGFEWEYPDSKTGLRDTVEWLIKMGWIR